MDLIMTMYLILAGVSVFITFAIIMVIAGKDIIFAFYRRFSKRGCDVFLVDNNKQVRHFFLTPKEGMFRIEKKPYITNPYKITNLTDDMQQDVMKKLDLKKKKLEKVMDRLKEKKIFIKKQLACIENKEENIPMINNLNMLNTDLDNKIALIESKLQDREEAYYLMKRPAYFYIENDPVPKDFFELFTEMDSTQLENVIIRAQTKDPKNLANLEKTIVNIKKLVAIAAFGAVAAALIAARVMMMVNQIGTNMGIKFSF